MQVAGMRPYQPFPSDRKVGCRGQPPEPATHNLKHIPYLCISGLSMRCITAVDAV